MSLTQPEAATSPGGGAARSIPVSIALLVTLAVLVFGGVFILARERQLTADDGLYASYATGWLTGRPAQSMSGQPVTSRAPGYPVALAGVIALEGDWSVAEPVVAAASVTVAVLLAVALAAALGGRWAAVLAAALALTPGLGTRLSTSAVDSLQIALVLGAVAVAVAAGRRSWSPILAIPAGLLISASILTKETTLLFLAWPLLWAFASGAGDRRRIRFATFATAVSMAALLPWWLFVWSSAGYLFPTRLGGPIATAGVAAMGVGTGILLVASLPPAIRRIDTYLGRFGDGRRWGLAVAGAAALAVGATLGFAVADPRFAIDHRPGFNALVEGLGSLAPLFAIPAAMPVTLVAAAVYAARPRTGLRGLLLASLLASPFLLIIVLKQWDPRSIALFATLSQILFAVVAARALGLLREGAGPFERRALSGGFAALLAVLVAGTALGYTVEWRTATESNPVSWQNDAVRSTARWLDEHASPGDTIVASWLYATSLDAETHGRYRILLAPTLQLRIGRPGQPPMVPTGTLFRETGVVPIAPPTDWMFLRKHPTEGYYVGMSSVDLERALQEPDVRWFVLSGEQVPQATATIAPTLVDWTGLGEQARFRYRDDEMIVYRVDPAAVSAVPSPLYLNDRTLRQWMADVATIRPGTGPGSAFRELLAGREFVIAPYDDATEQLAIALLEAP